MSEPGEPVHTGFTVAIPEITGDWLTVTSAITRHAPTAYVTRAVPPLIPVSAPAELTDAI